MSLEAPFAGKGNKRQRPSPVEEARHNRNTEKLSIYGKRGAAALERRREHEAVSKQIDAELHERSMRQKMAEAHEDIISPDGEDLTES